MSSISSGLPGLFQNAYYGSLSNSAMGGGLGVASNSGLGGLGFGGLMPGLVSGGGMMGDNLNPLAGHSALRGLGDFTNQVMYTGALRQMGYLPSTKGGGGGGAAGGGGGPQGMMQQLMQMFTMMQAMMSGDQTGGLGGQGGGFGGYPTQQPIPASYGFANPTGFGGGGFANPAAFGGGGFGSPAAFGGGFGGGGFGGGGNSLFSRVGDGFASIDTAINQTLGGIFNTLPLAKL